MKEVSLSGQSLSKDHSWRIAEYLKPPTSSQVVWEGFKKKH